MTWATVLKSSFADPFGGSIVINAGGTQSTATNLLWRAVQASLTCVLDLNNLNTGYVHVTTLEQYDGLTGVATGVTKSNTPSDPDYIADYIDTARCPAPSTPANNVTILVNANSTHYYDVYLTGANGNGTVYVLYNLGANNQATYPNTMNVPVDIYQVDIKHPGTHDLTTISPVVINGVNTNSSISSYFSTNNVSVPLTISLP